MTEVIIENLPNHKSVTIHVAEMRCAVEAHSNPCLGGGGTWRPFTVSWPSPAPVSTQDARVFANAILAVCDVADKMEHETKPTGEPNA